LITITNLYCQRDFSIDLIGSFDHADNINQIPIAVPVNTGFAPEDGHRSIFTYRYGMNFNFRIFDNVMFKSGLRFVTLGNLAYIKRSRWPSEVSPWGWNQNPLLPRYVDYSFLHRYFEIPLVIRFESTSLSRFHIFIETGLSPHIYYNTKVQTISDLKKWSNIADFSDLIRGFEKLQLALVLSCGFNYDINKQLTLFCQPTFRYHIQGIRSLIPISFSTLFNRIRDWNKEIFWLFF
jgi:hypothetical protein